MAWCSVGPPESVHGCPKLVKQRHDRLAEVDSAPCNCNSPPGRLAVADPWLPVRSGWNKRPLILSAANPSVAEGQGLTALH